MSKYGMGRKKRRAGFRKQRRNGRWAPRGGHKGKTNDAKRTRARREEREAKELFAAFSPEELRRLEIMAEFSGFEPAGMPLMPLIDVDGAMRADGWHVEIGPDERNTRRRTRYREQAARMRAEAMRRYYANREAILARMRERRASDHERFLGQRRADYARNKHRWADYQRRPEVRQRRNTRRRLARATRRAEVRA